MIFCFPIFLKWKINTITFLTTNEKQILFQPAVADYQGPFLYNTTGEPKKGIAGLASFFEKQWGEEGWPFCVGMVDIR